MPPAKMSIDTAIEAQSGLILGIISPEKSYKLAWRVNEIMDIDLVKTDNWMLQTAREEQGGFDMYEYRDDLRKTDYLLLRNKQNGYSASKVFSSYDYLFFVFGDLDGVFATGCYERFKRSAAIISVYLLDINASDIKF